MRNNKVVEFGWNAVAVAVDAARFETNMPLCNAGLREVL